MKQLVFIFFYLLIAEFSAQTASIVIESETNSSFEVTINHIKQHQGFENNIKINGLTGNYPYNIMLHFEDDTTIIKKNIYLIDNNLTHIYHLNKKSIQLKKILPSATYPVSKNQLSIPFINNTTLPIVSKDSIPLKDTTYVVPFASYYKLENYEGRIGCPFPISDVEQSQLRGIVLAENLEESKLEKVAIAIQEMDSACLFVDQTKELILLFEFEETRLEFAKFMLPYTFDIDNYERLYAVFNFDNSKDELKAFLKK